MSSCLKQIVLTLDCDWKEDRLFTFLVAMCLKKSWQVYVVPRPENHSVINVWPHKCSPEYMGLKDSTDTVVFCKSIMKGWNLFQLLMDHISNDNSYRFRSEFNSWRYWLLLVDVPILLSIYCMWLDTFKALVTAFVFKETAVDVCPLPSSILGGCQKSK